MDAVVDRDKMPPVDEKYPPETSSGSDSSLSAKEGDVPIVPKKNPKSVTVKSEVQDPLAHLSEHERNIIRRQIDLPTVKVGIKALYRYSTRNDLIIMAVSALCSIVAGAVMPLMTVVFGGLTTTFSNFFYGVTSKAEFNHLLGAYTLYFLYLGIVEFVTIYVSTVGFIYTGEHVTQKIRENYLLALLRQNIGFFDKLGAGEITTRITADTNLIQDGISEKVGLTLTAVATFITAFIIAYVRYWLLALILSCTIVAIVVIMGSGSSFIVKWNKAALSSYAAGGTVAEEVLSSIRNATAFGTQDKLAHEYDKHLAEAEKYGFKHKSAMGVMLGGMMFIIYANYALAFWEGSRLLVAGHGVTNVGKIITILLAIMIGAFSLGNVAPNIQAFTTSLAAASKIFTTIDRESPMDPHSKEGVILEHLEGTIELQNVKHIYPSRPEVVVMDDVSLIIPASKTTALVGQSGSGKSTVVGLVERFYDPVGGKVLLDGHNIRDLNLQSLRRHISLVSQEPTLFGTTIFGNIAHGLIGTQFEGCSTEKKKELIEDAAKMANAHDFITGLPEGYETQVGERGFLLSGGQKQRIAIARAVVSDPQILLLDEATSALDSRSEGVVQAALDKAAAGRTSIVIAHKLSTIRNAHNIVVMSEGRIIEQGTHNQLLDNQSTYYNLVEAQQIAAVTQDKDEEEVELIEENDILQRIPTSRSDEVPALLRTTTSRSISRTVLEKNTGHETTKYGLWTLIKLVASFNKNEMSIMFFGLFCSIIAGSGHPVQAVFFAKSIITLSLPPAQYGELRSGINFWAGMYFMLAWVQLIAYAAQGVAFAYCSERLVYRARDRVFRAYLRQSIDFFDHKENSAGALTSFLSTGTTQLAGLSGNTLGTILNVLTTLIGAFALSLAIGPKLAAVCISTVPIVLGCGFLRFWLLTRFSSRSKKAYEQSASYACENISAIRTVASLTRERDVWEEYHSQLVNQGKRSLQSILKSSILYASSQSLMFLCIALGFWYGGTLIGNREYDEQQFFICFSAVIFGAQSAGTVFSFAPDMGKAKGAAQDLKTLFDRNPKIDHWSTEGETVSTVSGALEFRDVHFRYPTRPEQPVLRGLNLSIQPGQYVALVGASGCGKVSFLRVVADIH